MAEHDIVYDPERGIAVLVDMDTMRALGPTAAGPNAESELRAFMNTMPPAVLDISSYELTRIWAEYWQREFGASYAENARTTEDAPKPDDDTRADDAALAEHEATETRGEPPAPGPADTDETPPPNPQTAVVTCYNCNGDGVIQHGEGEPATQCAMCGGTGRLEMPVPA